MIDNIKVSAKLNRTETQSQTDFAQQVVFVNMFKFNCIELERNFVEINRVIRRIIFRARVANSKKNELGSKILLRWEPFRRSFAELNYLEKHVYRSLKSFFFLIKTRKFSLSDF